VSGFEAVVNLASPFHSIGCRFVLKIGTIESICQNMPTDFGLHYKDFFREDSGQDLVEYSLLLAFIALAAIALLSSAGTSIKTIWTGINTQLTSAAAS
jgi:Flp pilus assembly pilin Flp